MLTLAIDFSKRQNCLLFIGVIIYKGWKD